VGTFPVLCRETTDIVIDMGQLLLTSSSVFVISFATMMGADWVISRMTRRW
jgi:hypothetical protein